MYGLRFHIFILDNGDNWNTPNNDWGETNNEHVYEDSNEFNNREGRGRGRGTNDFCSCIC